MDIKYLGVKQLPSRGHPRLRATTDAVDSQKDRVRKVTFRDHVRVLFAHQTDKFPVGELTEKYFGAGHVDADFKWYEGDQFVSRVKNLYDQGAFDASIGFTVTHAEKNSFGGFDLEGRVHEVSLTPVPANEGAIALAKSLPGVKQRSADHVLVLDDEDPNEVVLSLDDENPNEVIFTLEDEQ